MNYLPCGIDLGLDGGLVALVDNIVVDVIPTPSRRVKVANLKKSAKKDLYEISTKRLYDQPELMHRLANLKEMAVSLGFVGPVAVVEDATVRTGLSSPKTYFSTGGCLHLWQDSFTSLDIPFFMVAPVSWKAAMNMSGDKADSIAEVKRLGFKSNNQLVFNDHNIAEAALIAHWLTVTPAYKDLLDGNNPHFHRRKPKNRQRS